MYFRDGGGVEHGVYLRALNRYHAFGLAMNRMRQCSWSNPDFSSVQKMNVQLLEPNKFWKKVVVTREQFEAWLNKPGRQDERERQDIKMLLGRIPPDRDFKSRVMKR